MKGADSTSAWLAWLGLAIVINIWWISYDLWAWRTDHYTMTKQMRDWLHGPVSGPLIFGLLCFIVAAFMWHMLVRAAS